MNKQFEKWYCDTYWNFKIVENRQVFFTAGKYNHFDVDLAYNAWLAAASCCSEIAVNRQGTVSQFPTHKECVAFNAGCRDTATAIREAFGLEI